MRKLKLQVQMSIDGFIAGPENEMDWLTFNWDDALNQYVTAITEPVDCILLGKNLAQGFIPHWAAIAVDTSNPESAAGKKMTDTPKIVFSKTLEKSEWANTVIINTDFVEEIKKLKQQDGKDIIAYGGASFVSSLIKENLIDEFHLFVNPVILGKGLPIFGSITEKQTLKLHQAISFGCGIVLLNYISSLQNNG